MLYPNFVGGYNHSPMVALGQKIQKKTRSLWRNQLAQSNLSPNRPAHLHPHPKKSLVTCKQEKSKAMQTISFWKRQAHQAPEASPRSDVNALPG